MKRRTFIMAAGGAAAAVSAFPAQAEETAPSYAEQYPDMLLAHVASKLNGLAASWDRERERIRTAADVEARNQYVRLKFKEMIHGYPERTPLAARVIAIHERNGYRIENVMFQSRPNFWVTGNLYVPAAGKLPFPGVISPCGHYPLSRMEPEYQCAYIDMVRAGLVVLAYDPIGEGERRHYWNPETGRTEVATASTFEHSMPGQVLLMMGEDLTNYRVWDGMRAIDYLQSRPEVDGERIGCAGHSGGGTLTMFISALDERVKCAVINQGGTVHRWPVEVRPDSRVGPADVEQNFFPGAKNGVDLPDLHAAIAPRPLLATIEEYHPRFKRAAAEIGKRYAQLGVPERFATEASNDPHSWTPKLRLATTRWLSRWLLKSPGPETELDIDVERPETLYCTPHGSLRYSNTGESIFSLMAKRAEGLPPAGDQLRTKLAGSLRYKKTNAPLQAKLIVTTPRRGYSVEKLEFISEPGIYVPTWVFIPDGKAGNAPTLLVFNDAGKQADGEEFGLYERLTRAGHTVIACDVRGIGETKPPHTPASEWPREFGQLFDVETAITYMTWYADECLFGMRVQDVIRSVDYALSRRDVDGQRLQVVGKGAGALWVLFAAALDPRITDVVAERGLLSYGTLARNDRYTHSTGIFVRDLLLHCDVPQVMASLAGRKLTVVSPVDHLKRAVDPDVARQTYAIAAAAFRRAGQEERFRIVDTLW